MSAERWGRHGFERLDVFRLALDLLAWGDGVSPALERRRRSMNYHLQRAIDSALANVGEGATELSRADKRRFFRYALRSTGEASALIHGAERIRALPLAEIGEGKRIALSLRIRLLQLIGALRRRPTDGQTGRTSRRTPNRRPAPAPRSTPPSSPRPPPRG